MTFSDGLAVSAIVLSVVAILFEAFFYRWQTQQGQSITDKVTDLTKEMHGILGELRGRVDEILRSQQGQFSQVLDAYISDRTQKADAGVGDIRIELEALKSEIHEQASPKELIDKVESLGKSLDQVQEATREAARFAAEASERRPFIPGSGYRTSPLPPNRFFGAVRIDGQPAPVGTKVEALVRKQFPRGFVGNQNLSFLEAAIGPLDTIPCGSTSVISGNQYVLDVPHETRSAGCGRDGAAIIFLVAGARANETSMFQTGAFTLLDLTVTTSMR